MRSPLLYTACTLALLWVAVCPSTQAQPVSGTASELLSFGQAAYLAKDYPKAEAYFSKFLGDFGTSVEAKANLEQVKAILALSRVHQKKYKEAQPVIDEYLTAFPTGANAEELMFWRAMGFLAEKEEEKAVEAFKAFVTAYPRSTKRTDAEFLIGGAMVAGEKFKEAADWFESFAAKAPPAYAWKARPLELHCRIELGEFDKALALVRMFDGKWEELDSIALSHVLTLKLGDAFLEKDELRKSLLALQRVWPKARIEQRQTARLALLKQQLAGDEKSGSADPVQLFQKRQAVGQIEQEMSQLQKIPDYDTALSLRIARCFYGLDRQRESTLVLNELLPRLPDGPLREQADYLRLAGYVAMERWPAAAGAANDFLLHNAKSKLAPQVLAMQGEAQQRTNDYVAAVASFRKLVTDYPGAPQADRATFLTGYGLLMLDKNDEARAAFTDYQKNFPKGALLEQSYYWTGMTYSFAKDYENCRKAMQEYLRRYPDGSFKGEAIFRRAHSLYASKNFNDAYKELEVFLRGYPQHVRTDEARILLGDCYFALGEMDRGIASFKAVTKETPRFYEYAWFQVGKAYKLMEEPDKMLTHYQQFLRDSGDSPRAVEALYWMAWVYRKQEKPDEARRLYWDSIAKYGNEPSKVAVEDMLTGLFKLYPGEDGKAQLLGKLRDETETAIEKKQNTMAARLLWAQSLVFARKEPEKARALLAQAGGLIKPEEGSGRLLADIGDAYRLSGKADEATAAYEGLLSYFPRSGNKDRAYAGIGLLAAGIGKEKAALDAFAAFDRETVQSPLLPDVLKAKAAILRERRDYPGAIVELERILKVPSAKGKPWVEALYGIGASYQASGKPDKAMPYFQKIYIMYGRWPDYVAKAYWESGQAFEKLKRPEEAKSTYKEMTNRTDLEPFEETKKARARLQELG